MADKEQELLSTKQWDKLCKEYPLLDFSFQDGYAEEFRVILKALGYEQVWTECPECEGSGDKERDEPEGTFGSFYDCPTCKGTGRKRKLVEWDREKVLNLLSPKILISDAVKVADQLYKELNKEVSNG